MGGKSECGTSAGLLGRLRHDPPDQDAWGTFVDRYGSQVYSWCRRWGLQDADAGDVTQNVLLRLSRRLRTFEYDPRRSFHAWLWTVAQNARYEYASARVRPGAGSGDPHVLALLDTVEAPEDETARLNAEFDRELVQDAMDQVRRRVATHTWEAFRLLAIEGLSGAETAQRLGVRVSTAFKARSKVQGMLRAEVHRRLAHAEPFLAGQT